jgi:hypothetical protein
MIQQHPIVGNSALYGVPQTSEREGVLGKIQAVQRGMREPEVVVSRLYQGDIPTDEDVVPAPQKTSPTSPSKLRIYERAVFPPEAQELLIDTCATRFRYVNVVDAFPIRRDSNLA